MEYQTGDDDIFASSQRGLISATSNYADMAGPSTSSFSYDFEQIAAAAISGGSDTYDSGSAAGILTQDLVISDNEEDSCEPLMAAEISPGEDSQPTADRVSNSPETSNFGYELGGDFDPVSQSRIGLVGQLHNDLAMSDSDAERSDDSDTGGREPKRKISRLQAGADDDSLFHM